MEINKETVAFISDLNAMAKRTADKKRGRLTPFSVLRWEKTMRDLYENSGFGIETRIFYDDKSPTVIYDEIFYPIVTDAVLECGKLQIVTVSNHFFAVFPKKRTEEEQKDKKLIRVPAHILAIMSVSDDLAFDTNDAGNTILIEKGEWLVIPV